MTSETDSLTDVEVYAVRDEDGVRLEHDSDLSVDTVNAPRHYIDKRFVSDGQRVMTATMDGKFSHSYSIPDEVATDRAYEKGWVESQQPADAHCPYCGETKAVMRGSPECIECETVFVFESKEDMENHDGPGRAEPFQDRGLPNVMEGEGMVVGVAFEQEIPRIGENRTEMQVTTEGGNVSGWTNVIDRYIDRTRLEEGMVALCVETSTNGHPIRVHLDPRCAEDWTHEHDHSDGAVDEHGVEVYVEHGTLHRAAESDEHPHVGSEPETLDEVFN